MDWTCGVYGWGEGVYRVLVGKPEGKRPLGRPRRRWVDNIRMDLQEVGCEYMDWIGLAQHRDRGRTLVSAAWAFGFREMRGISWLAAYQLAAQEGLHQWVSICLYCIHCSTAMQNLSMQDPYEFIVYVLRNVKQFSCAHFAVTCSTVMPEVSKQST